MIDGRDGLLDYFHDYSRVLAHFLRCLACHNKNNRKKCQMKSSQILIATLLCFACSSPAIGSSIDILGVRSSGLTGSTEMKGKTDSKESFIPAKSGGKIIDFTPAEGEVNHLLPTGKARFCPHLDTADFTNFVSAHVVRNRVLRKEHINHGTCFGVSYFTCIYYSRIVRPVQMGVRPNVLKQYDYDITFFDGFRETAHVGSAPCDGVEYLVYEAMKSTPEKHGRPFWNNDNLKGHLDEYRLRAMSKDHDKAIKVGAISHHLDQRSCHRVRFDASNGNELERHINQIMERIEKNGTQMFFWSHYQVSDSWYSWDKRDWGHACLFYRISEFTVEGTNGTSRRALKFHVYDPNTNYSKSGHCSSGEGYGDYMIYFPDSKQISFSSRMKRRYQMQSSSSTVDNREDKLGYYDIHEGHPTQNQIAKEAFFRGYTGLGRVLARDEIQQAEENGKVELENRYLD